MPRHAYHCSYCNILLSADDTECSGCKNPGPVGAFISQGLSLSPQGFLWALYPQDVVIGQQLSSDVVLWSPGVSARHVRMEWRGGNFFIHRKAGDPEIYLNGRPLATTTAQVLNSGTRLRFGQEEVEFLHFKNAREANPMTAARRQELKLLGESLVNPSIHRAMLLSALTMELFNCRTAQEILTLGIDTVLSLSELERGYGFVVRHDGDQMDVKELAARNEAGQDIKDNEFKISRSVMEKVFTSGGSMLIEDADHRSSNATESMRSFNIKSVACLPLINPGNQELIGFLYWDRTLTAAPMPRGITSSMQTVASLLAMHLAWVTELQNVATLKKQYQQLCEHITQELGSVSESLHSVEEGLITQSHSREDIVAVLDACATHLEQLTQQIKLACQ